MVQKTQKCVKNNKHLKAIMSNSVKSKPISKVAKKASPAAQKLKERTGPKWDLAKLAMGQFLSMTSYMTVLNITNLVAVRNQHGTTMQMSRELLETMYSA